MFVKVSHLHPNLMFGNTKGRTPLQVWYSITVANIRLGQKCATSTNTLAYYSKVKENYSVRPGRNHDPTDALGSTVSKTDFRTIRPAKGRHDTQHNDTQHNIYEKNATLSIMTPNE